MNPVKRALVWLWKIGDRTVKVRYAGLAVVLITFSLILVQFQIDDINRAAREQDREQASKEIYEAELFSYNNALTTYESCLSRVQARLDARDVFLYLTTLPGVAGSPQADLFRDYVDEKLPTLDPATCVQPLKPTPPDLD